MHVIDRCKSEVLEITAGVPQGSRLGLLLWIIFINDIFDDLESEVLLFADDSCLFSSGEDPAITARIINKDLKKKNLLRQPNGKLFLMVEKARIIYFLKTNIFSINLHLY